MHVEPSREKKGFSSAREIDPLIDQFLTVTCEKSRRSILEFLAQSHEGVQGGVERRFSDIVAKLGLSKATVSEHVQRLVALHLVTARKEGTETYYRLGNHQLMSIYWDLLQSLRRYYRSHAP